jgi:hypothetical protein
MHFIGKLATLVAFAAASGASLAQTEIEAIDRGRLVPSFRLSADIEPRVDGPAVPHTGHGIEFGMTGASGEDGQTVGTSQPPVVFGGRVFPAGSELRHEFDFRFVELAYRYRHFFGGPTGTFGIEALGGLGYMEFDLTTRSALQTANEKLGSGGLVAGFGIVWKFLPRTSLQSRLMLFGSGETEGVTGAARWDVHVAHALGRHVALRAGLVAWGLGSARVDDEDASSLNSQIRAGFSGISLGLDVAF